MHHHVVSCPSSPSTRGCWLYHHAWDSCGTMVVDFNSDPLPKRKGWFWVRPSFPRLDPHRTRPRRGRDRRESGHPRRALEREARLVGWHCATGASRCVSVRYVVEGRPRQDVEETCRKETHKPCKVQPSPTKGRSAIRRRCVEGGEGQKATATPVHGRWTIERIHRKTRRS